MIKKNKKEMVNAGLLADLPWQIENFVSELRILGDYAKDIKFYINDAKVDKRLERSNKTAKALNKEIREVNALITDFMKKLNKTRNKWRAVKNGIV